MKIVFAHDHRIYKYKNSYYSSGGLSDEVLKRYTDIFEQVTVLCRVIFIDKKKGNLSKITNENINFVNCRWLSSVYRNEVRSADAVISRLPSINGMKVISYARKKKIPYFTELVGCPWDALWNHGLKGKLVSPFITIITKHQVKKSEYVLYVTKEFLQRRYPTSGINLSCSDVKIPLTSYSVEEKKIKKLETLGQPYRTVKIGTLAAIDVKYKGQQHVLGAIEILKKRGYKIHYDIVGNGSKEFLAHIIKNKNISKEVEIIGALPHLEVMSWLDEIDIYVQPSKQEGLPRALVEAMSRGCVCLGSNVGGIPELLEKKFIFSKIKPEVIANLIEKTINRIDGLDPIKQSKSCFEKAKDFEGNRLEIFRNDFYIDFRNHVRQKQESRKVE